MPVELGHAELLRNWFTPAREGEDGTDVSVRLSMKMDLERISDQLSELWFSADYSWTSWSGADVLDVIRQWLPSGSSEEGQFTQYAVAGTLPEFLSWLEPLIREWQAQETQATAENGIENSEYPRDPIPGTRYYRWVGGEYLYSDDQNAPYVPDGPAWKSMEDRIEAQDRTKAYYDPDLDRWRLPTRDGGYSLQNRDTGLWELYYSDQFGWLPYDQASETWLYQGQWSSRSDIEAAIARGRVKALRELFEAVPEARKLTPQQLHDAIARAQA